MTTESMIEQPSEPSAKSDTDHQPISKDSLAFIDGISYYIGVWRRTPYKLNDIPYTMNGSKDSLFLSG